MKSLWVAFLILAAPVNVSAFCGFYVSGGGASLYNDATQAVLMRHNKQTVLSMQNAYEGPLEDFAMVVPVPQVLQKDNIKTLKKEVFDRVDVLSAPRLVEYWEQDPCNPHQGWTIGGFGGLGLSGTGRGGGGLGAGPGGFVTVRAQFEVGEYDISILETNEATALEKWLKTHKYAIPDGAEPYFRPYVESGMYFFVARVDAKRVKYENGRAVLSPLRFHYTSDEFSLPVRLGLINSKGTQDLLVYVLAQDQRYEVANLPNVTIPTNINVAPTVRDGFANFYEALFSRTVEENPGAVVTEYSWQANKCDPCPTGLTGGAALTEEDVAMLGADTLRLTGWENMNRWTLTRLHARYGRDGAGADLIFKKADPIAGGRELMDGTTLEKNTRSAAANQFQGRYIMRNEWQGKVECAEPQFGTWGGPPDAVQMRKMRDVLVLERRRQALIAGGKDPNTATAAPPYTPEEESAFAFHLRREFGTAAVPVGESNAPSVAPSANTRGGAPGVKEVNLAAMLREPVLGVEPLPTTPTNNQPAPPIDIPTTDPAVGATAGQTVGATAGQTPDAPTPVASTGCQTVLGGVELGLFAIFGLRRRRKSD